MNKFRYGWYSNIIIIFIVSIIFLPCITNAQEINPYANETKEQRDARMKWWHEARFGMFIHWGVYSVPAGTYEGEKIAGIGEWIMLRGKIPVARYEEYAKQFNPVKYDPDAWVKLAKEAGMKYIVITSKHHDGFALFDSKVTDWDVVDATPYGKDLLKPLADACKKHGIKLGFYYSQAQDWHHPGGAAARGGHWDKAQEGSMDDYIKKIAAPQVKEILTNYGDLAILWWDTPVNMTKERADTLLPLIKLQPGIITNNRLYRGEPEYAGDTETPEQHIPPTGFKDRDFEVCMTMNNTWGYKSYDDNWKSTETLIHNLIDIASKGGNYLLNVGPTAEGLIPAPSVERLGEIGEWMKINSEAIYATTASPFYHLSWGRCTKKVNDSSTTLYLHVFDWPADGRLIIPGLRNEVSSAKLLADGKVLETSSEGNDVIVKLPQQAPNEIASVIQVEVEGELDVLSNMPRQQEDGLIVLPAMLAKIHNRGYGEHARLDKKNGQMVITNWTDHRARIEWMFAVNTPGAYAVLAEIASAEPNSCILEIGDESLKTVLAPTGGAGKFQLVEIGTIQIKSKGNHVLKISPKKDKWKGVTLRGVHIKPVN